jgi:hypothetical protein
MFSSLHLYVAGGKRRTLEGRQAAMKSNRNPVQIALWAVVLMVLTASHALAAPPQTCKRIVLTGDVTAGQEWKADLGQGWVFRVVPIQPGKEGYTGWDLVVDRTEPAGHPDALLVATPPYYSISEREVGTTFGLRAQDAIGWNPRSFHFLTDPDAFRESQKQFRALGGTKIWTESPHPSSQHQLAEQRLLEINRHASPGQLRILNARLTPGIADPAPFAQRWALQSARTPHTIVPSTAANPTPLGQLHWMRFSITLWLPAAFKAPRELPSTPSPSSQ